MAIPMGVISVFAALAVWAGLAVYALRRKRYPGVILFGVALMLYLNVGYVVNGPAASIANFVGIYDVLINLGLSDLSRAAAVTTCPDNACSVWGDTYTNHPAWGAAFYNRFANGSDMRSGLLVGHIICTSIVFVLMHIQMVFPGTQARFHAALGKVSFSILTVGVVCAAILALQHGPVSEYGGSLSTWGFLSMSVFVYGTAILGVRAIRSGDAARHRIWMWRFVGAMWGSFWVFRVLLFVIDPIFRNQEALAILVCIWGSAPAGIIIADLIRRRVDAHALASPNTAAAHAMVASEQR
jgi:hypothetical protein